MRRRELRRAGSVGSVAVEDVSLTDSAIANRKVTGTR